MWVRYTTLFLATGVFSASVIRHTNLECVMMDPGYASFARCDLKVIGRGTVGLSVYINLTVPVTNAKVNLSLWRKFSGYRPFMYNVTFDFCKFISQNNNKLSLPKIFFDSISNSSNLNHSCPYYNEIRVHNMVMMEEHYKFMPLPSGQYKYKVTLGTDSKWRATISAYFERQEDLMKS